MNKAVLISIRPKWCELIVSGKKLIEVRKTVPKLESPFRCFIYETKGKGNTTNKGEDGHAVFRGRGLVIGEFMCDRVFQYATAHDKVTADISDEDMELLSCLDHETLVQYENRTPTRKVSSYGLFGWHISALNIYDKPRELREFYRPSHDGVHRKREHYDFNEASCRPEHDNQKWRIRRPPQSWCYVEDSRSGQFGSDIE